MHMLMFYVIGVFSENSVLLLRLLPTPFQKHGCYISVLLNSSYTASGGEGGHFRDVGGQFWLT